jgi:hypothetical protein
MQRYTVYFIWKLLYMFRVVLPPIIRSANNCIYSIWYLSDRYCYLPLSQQVALTVWQIPDAVYIVVCAPDDGWWYHPKHVKHFSGKIYCVTLHLVGYILERCWCFLWFSKQTEITVLYAVNICFMYTVCFLWGRTWILKQLSEHRSQM